MPRDLVHAALGGVVGALVAMGFLILVLVFVLDEDPVVPAPPPSTFGTTIELPDVCEQLPTRC